MIGKKGVTQLRGIHQRSSGFTIIELMIATLVFSVVLLIITAGLLSIGRSYYKGTTSVQTQAAASAIVQSVGQDIQFSGGSVINKSGTYHMWCVGSRRYTYAPGLQQGAVGSPQNVMVADNASASCSGSTPIPDLNLALNSAQYGKAQSLLGPKMRIAKLDITSLPMNTYAVSVRVVYGDDDLLCSPSVSGDCAASGVSTNLSNNDLMCKSIRAGTQFCSAAEINTTVVKRVR